MKIFATYTAACQVHVFEFDGELVCGGCTITDNKKFATTSVNQMIIHLQDHRIANKPVPTNVERHIREAYPEGKVINSGKPGQGTRSR